MHWERAVHHVAALAQSCDEMAASEFSIVALRVVELWAYGDILGAPRDLDFVSVALVVDVPVVPWRTEPPAAQQWAHATRMVKNPVHVEWRSAHAPVWNHEIVAPVRVWDGAGGVREDAVTALREGRGSSVGLEPVAAEVRRARVLEELKVSETELRTRMTEYEEHRWSRGRLDARADALCRASVGYLEVLDASRRDLR